MGKRFYFAGAAVLLLSISTLARAVSFVDQWALENTGQRVCKYDGSGCTQGKVGSDIKFKESPALDSDCSAVTVAVLDTGADYTHPSLASNLLPGKTFVSRRQDDTTPVTEAQDDNEHGTHVSGIIAANGSALGGLRGICKRAKVLEVKVIDYGGYLTDDNIIAGIQYASSQGARVLNLSFGGPRPNPLMEDAIRSASNTLFVIAAGNGSAVWIGYDLDQKPEYPAAYNLENTVTVAATDANDNLADFSNFGFKTVALAAPGVNIMSTTPMNETYPMSRYNWPIQAGSFNGTSMAAPFVTGAAALLWSSDTHQTLRQVKTRLLNAVDKVDGLKGKVRTEGRLNLSKLFQQPRAEK